MGDRSRRWLHIGFDVEGSPAILDEILAILREFGYQTTFWLQGEWVELYPEAARRIVEDGHEVANHSWTHRNFRNLTEEEIRWELERTEDLAKQITGHSTKPYFRPPYGARNDLSRRVAYELGYTHIIWTFDARDWEPGATEDSVYHNIVDNATAGAIFYMHTSKPYNPPALRRALQTLTEAGWELVSLTEILSSP